MLATLLEATRPVGRARHEPAPRARAASGSCGTASRSTTRRSPGCCTQIAVDRGVPHRAPQLLRDHGRGRVHASSPTSRSHVGGGRGRDGRDVGRDERRRRRRRGRHQRGARPRRRSSGSTRAEIATDKAGHHPAARDARARRDRSGAACRSSRPASRRGPGCATATSGCGRSRLALRRPPRRPLHARAPSTPRSSSRCTARTRSTTPRVALAAAQAHVGDAARRGVGARGLRRE